MMYEDRFVAVVMCDGKVLRERDGVVSLPFGSDYGLRLKNLNSVRALVKVSVDGDDVLGGNDIVVPANGATDLDGFMDASGNVRRRFRVVKNTEDHVRPRGDRLDDGIVRVEFRFEKRPPVVRHETVERTYIDRRDWWGPPWHPYPNPYPYPGLRPRPSPWITWTAGRLSTYTPDCGGSTLATHTLEGSGGGPRATMCSLSMPTSAGIAPDEGITVKGAGADQRFTDVSVGPVEEASSVIAIRLRGETRSGKRVVEPLTTRKKVPCPACGRKSPSSASYCQFCGSAMDC